MTDDDEIGELSKFLERLRKLGIAEVKTPLGWVDIIVVIAMLVAFLRSPPEFFVSNQILVTVLFLGGIGYVSAREAEKNLDKRHTREAKLKGHR